MFLLNQWVTMGYALNLRAEEANQISHRHKQPRQGLGLTTNILPLLNATKLSKYSLTNGKEVDFHVKGKVESTYIDSPLMECNLERSVVVYDLDMNSYKILPPILREISSDFC